MKKLLILFLFSISISSFSQSSTIDQIIEEATDNSQLEVLAHELFDLIGPRLVGTPQMNSSEQNSYAVDGSHEVMDLKYKLMPTEGTNQTD